MREPADQTETAVWRRRRVLAALGVTTTGLAMGCAAAQEAPQAPQSRLRRRLLEQRGISLPELPEDLPTARYDDPHARPGPFAVDDVQGIWVDEARSGRHVPWRAYLPQADEAAPVLIYSHGGGGTRDSGETFGRHLASHGLASLHLQHLGSDRDAFREDAQQISRAVRDPQYGAVRFQDVGYAVEQIRTAAEDVLRRLDPDRAGVYGHSFGAITAQIVAGQSVEGFGQSLALPSLKAAAALSPSPPRPGYGTAETAFRNMLMPIAHITGTEDHAPNGDFDAPARLVPFEQISTVEQHLLVLAGANHFTFSGDPDPALRGLSFSYPGLPRHHDLIRAMLTAFFRLHLAGVEGERSYLSAKGLGAALTQADRLDFKGAA